MVMLYQNKYFLNRVIQYKPDFKFPGVEIY